jgi:ABC-type polysaccharide/polyol phosphate transport system ATPase subunit
MTTVSATLLFWMRKDAANPELAQRPVKLLALRLDDILRRLCNKAAWLSHGNLMAFGEFEGVISAYCNPNSPAQQPASA